MNSYTHCTVAMMTVALHPFHSAFSFSHSYDNLHALQEIGTLDPLSSLLSHRLRKLLSLLLRLQSPLQPTLLVSWQIDRLSSKRNLRRQRI